MLRSGVGSGWLRRRMIRLAAGLVVLPALYVAARSLFDHTMAAALAASSMSYSTKFRRAENSISEGGHWLNGKKDAVDWTDIRTTPGFAFSTEIGGDRPPLLKYDDSTALLTGHWTPNQTAQATVHRTNRDNDNIYQEVELRLRSTLSPHNATGYEVMFRCSKSANAYCSIARWDGILGAWMMLKETKGAEYGVADGDVVKAGIAGDTITVYLNSKEIVQARDYLFTSGNPGMGFYLEKATGVNDQCGFSSFAAWDNRFAAWRRKPARDRLRVRSV